MKRWELTDKEKARSAPAVLEFLKSIDEDHSGDLKEIDLSDSDFNPFALCNYLEELGYEKGIQDDNGWQLDFWIPFRKDGHTPVEVFGTGLMFEVGLRELDYDWKEKEKITEKSLSELCNEIINVLNEVRDI